MPALTAQTHLPTATNFPNSPASRRRRRIPPSIAVSNNPHFPTLKCHQSSSSQTPQPVQSNPSKPHIKSIVKALALSSSVTLVLKFCSFLGNGDGNFGGGSGGGGGGGGGGDESGGFWRRFFSPAALADEPQTREWDSHGLPANIVVQLNKLSGFKKYKVSDIQFFDRRRKTTVGTEDSFFEMVSLRPGGIYTKAQLQKELENLATCGMFEKVDLEGKTNTDGTLGITISFNESTWQSANRFRCINVGLMKQSKPMEMDADMTDKEKMAYFRSQEREYKRRIDRARPCLLPESVEREVLRMLRDRGKVSARLLQKIRDTVQKWYHDEGYACAQVVNFGNLNTKEVVCEVVEGDITQLVIQFQDKLGNVVEGNTQLPVVRRELPKQVESYITFTWCLIVSIIVGSIKILILKFDACGPI